MIFDLLETLFGRYGAWTWFVLGFILLGLELMFPTFVVIWFAAGAVIVGFLEIFIDWPIRTMILTWLLVSVGLLIITPRWFRRKAGSKAPLLNDRAGRLIGRVFTLSEPLGENGGRLVIDDGTWRVSGPALPAGTRVVVRAVDGITLLVEPAEPN